MTGQINWLTSLLWVLGIVVLQSCMLWRDWLGKTYTWDLRGIKGHAYGRMLTLQHASQREYALNGVSLLQHSVPTMRLLP